MESRYHGRVRERETGGRKSQTGASRWRRQRQDTGYGAPEDDVLSACGAPPANQYGMSKNGYPVRTYVWVIPGLHRLVTLIIVTCGALNLLFYSHFL